MFPKWYAILKTQISALSTWSFNIWPREPQGKKYTEEAQKKFVLCFHMYFLTV